MLELKIGTADRGMGLLEFISSMTGSLAWPLALIMVAIVFRKHIGGLFKRIEEIGFGGATAKLSKELDKAEAIATTLPELAAPEQESPSTENSALPAAPSPPTLVDNLEYNPLDDPNYRFRSLLLLSPSAAVLEAWYPVENAIRQLAARHRVTGKPFRRNLPSMVNQLALDGEIPPSVITMITELLRIRNLASHARDVSADDALRFKRLADDVLHTILYKAPS